MMENCMICDLYAVIDEYGDPGSDFVADLVTVLPPRGHAFHNLAIQQQHYRTRKLSPNAQSVTDTLQRLKPR